MLPANAPVLRALALPLEYAITDAESRRRAAMLARLEARACAGPELLQVRDKDLPPERDAFVRRRCTLAQRTARACWSMRRGAGARVGATACT